MSAQSQKIRFILNDLPQPCIKPLYFSFQQSGNRCLKTCNIFFQDLGEISFIRIWHNNSGKDPSWFISRITVTDLMKNKQSIFICQSWLGIGIGDGRIDRIFTASKDEIVKDIETLFLANASKGITDDHIWFSILMRPPRNQFTRCQRVSCCLSTLLCTMLANAMFYQKDKVVGVTIDLGSFKFSWTQIMIGIQSALIVFPINLLIVTLFRKFTARRIEKESKLPMTEDEDLFKVTNLNKKQNEKSLKNDIINEANDLDLKGQPQVKRTNVKKPKRKKLMATNLKKDLSTSTMNVADMLKEQGNRTDDKLKVHRNVKHNKGHGKSPYLVDPSNHSQQAAVPTIKISPTAKDKKFTLNSRLNKSPQSFVHHVGENTNHRAVSEKNNHNAIVQRENVLNRSTAPVSSMQEIGTEIIRDESILLNINLGGKSSGKKAISRLFFR